MRLADGGADLQDADENGSTALLFAAANGHIAVAQLLQRGARPNAADKRDTTPLHIAAMKGHTDMCHLLLECKADINPITGGGWTPVKWAMEEGRTATAEALRAKGGVA